MTTQQVLHRTDVVALTEKLGTASTAPTDPGTAKLVGAAKEFEAMMLGELLKPLKFGAGIDESAGGAADTMRDMSTEALAQSLASKGGIGIAAKIVGQVSAEHEAAAKRKGGTKVV